MELLHATNIESNKVVCRLGAIYNKPYNEYEFGEEVYQTLREYLIKTKRT